MGNEKANAGSPALANANENAGSPALANANEAVRLAALHCFRPDADNCLTEAKTQKPTTHVYNQFSVFHS